MTLGKKITAMRRAACMTQEELGFALNVSRQTIAQWEADVASPKADKIIELCRIFRVSADYLLLDVKSAAGEIAAADGRQTVLPVVRHSGRVKALFACSLVVGILSFMAAAVLVVLLVMNPETGSVARYSIEFNFIGMVALIVVTLLLSATSVTLAIVAGRMRTVVLPSDPKN